MGNGYTTRWEAGYRARTPRHFTSFHMASTLVTGS